MRAVPLFVAACVLAACNHAARPALPTTNNRVAPEKPEEKTTHLRVVIQIAYSDTCPARHRFVVLVDDVQRGAIEPPCTPPVRPTIGPNGNRTIVIESGVKTAGFPAFDVPPGIYDITVRETVSGRSVADTIVFPQYAAPSPRWPPGTKLPQLETLPVAFTDDRELMGPLVDDF